MLLHHMSLCVGPCVERRVPFRSLHHSQGEAHVDLRVVGVLFSATECKDPIMQEYKKKASPAQREIQASS